jgi:hypothetical protein
MKRWTENESTFLKENFINMTTKDIASALNRSYGSVRRHLKTLNLKKIRMIRKFFIGKKIGLLTIVEFVGSDKKDTKYLCECDCGTSKIVSYDNLMSNNTKSCGCIRNINLEKTQYNTFLKMYKRSAYKRGIKFILTPEEFMEIIHKNCYYCDDVPTEKPLRKALKNDAILKNRTISVNGIDRKDNSIGYTIVNCVPCCKTCNFMKRNMGDKEFLAHIDKIHKNKHRDLTIISV